VKRGDEIYFGDRVAMKRASKNVSATMWSVNRGKKKCFGDQAVLRRHDKTCLSNPCLVQEVAGGFEQPRSDENGFSDHVN
jgi:hypothetical protein